MYFLSSHDQAIYGRTFKGSMVVRREVLWSYEQRVLGRTTKEPLNEREREWIKRAWNAMVSEQFLNGSERKGIKKNAWRRLSSWNFELLKKVERLAAHAGSRSLYIKTLTIMSACYE